MRPHFGVDQADTETLAAIMASEFGSKRLDLVVDDASHLLDPTRASFELLFPLLRPGGTYLIEDWDWEHTYLRAFLDLLEHDPRQALSSFRHLQMSRHPLRAVALGALGDLMAGDPPPALERLVRDHQVVLHPGSYRPLSDIVAEWALTHAHQPDIVAEVTVKNWRVTITRGPGPAPSDWRLGAPARHHWLGS